MDNLDIDGTKKMADDIYSSFTNFGAKSYLVINKVAEYCTPPSGATTISVDATSSSSLGSSSSSSSYVSNSYYNKTLAVQQLEDYDISGMLSKQVGMNIICTIPCYCDIQFSRREFLSVLKYPDHPFAKRIENLAEDKQIKVKYRRKEHD